MVFSQPPPPLQRNVRQAPPPPYPTSAVIRLLAFKAMPEYARTSFNRSTVAEYKCARNPRYENVPRNRMLVILKGLLTDPHHKDFLQFYKVPNASLLLSNIIFFCGSSHFNSSPRQLSARHYTMALGVRYHYSPRQKSVGDNVRFLPFYREKVFIFVSFLFCNGGSLFMRAPLKVTAFFTPSRVKKG